MNDKKSFLTVGDRSAVVLTGVSKRDGLVDSSTKPIASHHNQQEEIVTAMNILAHTNASAQEHCRSPGAIFKHFARILSKYASFSTSYYALSWYSETRNGILHSRETPS